MLTRHTGVDKINEDFAYNLKASLSTVSFVELKKNLCNFYINNLNIFSKTDVHKDQNLVSMMYSEHLKRWKTKHTG